jgi:hypothetical protein
VIGYRWVVLVLLLLVSCSGSGRELPVVPTEPPLKAGYQCRLVSHKAVEEVVGYPVARFADYPDPGWREMDFDGLGWSSCKSEENSKTQFTYVLLGDRIEKPIEAEAVLRQFRQWQRKDSVEKLPASWGEGYLAPSSGFLINRKCTAKTKYFFEVYYNGDLKEPGDWSPFIIEAIRGSDGFYKCTQPRLPAGASLTSPSGTPTSATPKATIPKSASLSP